METVAVIGAGIIGSSIAWKLAKHGFRVTVFDADGFGREASLAGAGMVTPAGELQEGDPWFELGLESFRLYPSFIQELEEDSKRQVEFRQCGALHVFSSPEEKQHWVQVASVLERYGIRSQLLGRNELEEFVPELPPAYREGILFPEEGNFNPEQMMQALESACRRCGVKLLEDTPVEAVDCSSRGVALQTRSGESQFDAAVLAAGAWSSSIPVRRDGETVPLPETFPVKGHLVSYDFAPGVLKVILWHGHTYIFQRANGEVILGSSEQLVGFDRNVDPGVVEDLLRRGGSLWPPLSTRSYRRVWIGFRPGRKPGSFPISRLADTRLWLAYGHYRQGMLMAPGTAARITTDILASLGRTQA